VVIEIGMPERAIDVSMLHAGVGSHFIEEQRGFVALFTSDGEEPKWLLAVGTWPNTFFP
jgi:hypothetical protein